MPRDGAFVPRELKWTAEHVQRFWSYLAASSQADRAYFSSHSGEALIAFVERHVPLAGRRVLDYGCGPGFLLERLLRRGVRAEGLEFSPESVELTRTRCGGHPLFGGVTLAEAVPSPIPTGSADVVFLVEVLEHLLPEQLVTTLADARRLLRVGGTLVLTTPHAEDLESAKTICPECGTVFHPWQHLGCFTVPDLRRLLAEHGLETLVCHATTLGGRWPGRAWRKLQRALAPASAPPEPHLVGIGRKRA